MADGEGLKSDSDYVPLGKSDVFDALSSLGKTETNIERRSERLSEENVVVGDEDALRDEIVEEVRKEFPARPQGLREEWEEKTGIGRKEVVGIRDENVREEENKSGNQVVRKKEKKILSHAI